MARSSKDWMKKTAEQIVVRGDFMDRPDKSLAKVMHGMAELCKDMPGFVGVSAAGSRTLGYSITEESGLPNIPAGYRSDYDLNLIFDIPPSDPDLKLDMIEAKSLLKTSELRAEHSLPEVATHVCNVSPIKFLSLLNGMMNQRDRNYWIVPEVALSLQVLFLPSTGGKIKKYQSMMSQLVSDFFEGRDDFDYFMDSITNALADWDIFRFNKIKDRLGLPEKYKSVLKKTRKVLWRKHLMKYLKLRAGAVKS